jgi:hypothetical protein
MIDVAAISSDFRIGGMWSQNPTELSLRDRKMLPMIIVIAALRHRVVLQKIPVTDPMVVSSTNAGDLKLIGWRTDWRYESSRESN